MSDFVFTFLPGWTEVLQLMVLGDKWEVYIPWDKAYGEHGRPPTIPPYARSSSYF